MENIDLISESRQETEKGAKFRGRARVSLDSLHFPLRIPRELDRNNVKRLKGIFECKLDRLDPKHHIPALIKASALEQAIRVARTSFASLLENTLGQLPLLVFPRDSLQCLHGKHRIQAAKESNLPEAERWWVIKFYLDDMSTETQASLIEDYANSKRFSDGWLYRKIRATTSYERQHWLAWLTDCKTVILKQLFSHTKLSEALQELEQIPALLEDLEITQWHKIMATHSDEDAQQEFIHYLKHAIMKTWKTIAGNNSETMKCLDAETVRCAQSRCPGISTEDRDYLWAKIESGHIFGNVGAEQEKGEVWKALRAIKIPIPTLRTLQQDLKYFNAPSRVLRRLLSPPKSEKKKRKLIHSTLFQATATDPPKQQPSLRTLAKKYFRSSRTPNHYVLQLPNRQFVSVRGSSDVQFETAFQQLYLSIMRRIFDLDGNEKPLKEVGTKGWTARNADPVEEFQLAEEAFAFGFESPEIMRLRAMNPFMERARRQLADQDIAKYDPNSLNLVLRATADMYAAASNDVALQSKSEANMLRTDDGPPVRRRSGRQGAKSYESDKMHMFLGIIHRPVTGWNRTITTLFVRKSVFLAFFPSLNIEPSEENLDHGPEELMPPEPASEFMHGADNTRDDAEISVTNQNSTVSPGPTSNTMQEQGVASEEPTFLGAEGIQVPPVVQRMGKRQRVGEAAHASSSETINDQAQISATPDVETESSSPTITVYKQNIEGQREEIGRCASEEEVLHLLQHYKSLGYDPIDNQGRTIAPRECFDFALGRDNVLVLDEEK